MIDTEPFSQQSVTWIYGDSFVADPGADETWYSRWARCRSPRTVYRSEIGSGPERAVMQWHSDHQKGLHKQGDRVLIAISEISRLYQDDLAEINAWTALHHAKNTAQWQAIKAYYLHLAARQEPIWGIRLQSLLLWLDQQLAGSPAETLIAHSFAHLPRAHSYQACADLELNHVGHWFKNADNIWPSLMYFALTDPQAPSSIANDTRTAHMSEQQHELVYRLLCEHSQGDRILVAQPQGFQTLCSL